MRIAITGGAGFLGSRLARAVLDAGSLSVAGGPVQKVTTVRLLDRVAPDAALLTDERVDAVVGDLVDQLEADPLRDVDLVVHLAATVSGEAERDFDTGMANNVDASRVLFESCRRLPVPPVVVFASSVAVFGAVPGYPLPPEIRDHTLPIPRSSYGVEKVMTEQLLSDYTRRGYARGRSVRLMTVTVRPGRPNAAASSFVSGIIREPLAGEHAVCPVPETTEIAVSSPRGAIHGLLCAASASDDVWGSSVAMNLPPLTVTPREMVAAMDRVTGRRASELVEWSIDQAVVDVVATWPSRFRTERATALGLAAEPDFDSIVREYLSGVGRESYSPGPSSVRLVDDFSAAMHARDPVARSLGMSIDRSEPGSATVSMTLTEQMMNGLGVCHGGIVFTLADTAMAHASNAGNGRTLATSASIEWVRAAHIGDRLTATSVVVARRGRNMVHDIEVTNGAGDVVALVRGQTLTLNKGVVVDSLVDGEEGVRD